ncbi:MAG: ATP-binding cassette domain-containing protein [Pseudomonadota bacterium]
MDGLQTRASEILEIKNLSITLPKGSDRKYAVQNISLTLRRGELRCVVGESGSGKSVMTSAIMNDVPPRLGIESGEVLFDGEDVLKFSRSKLYEVRGVRVSMIYQEPMAALNPSLRVTAQISEVINIIKRGVMVEYGTAHQVFNNPQHDYTKKLLAAAPGKGWHLPCLKPEEAHRIAANVSRARPRNLFFERL